MTRIDGSGHSPAPDVDRSPPSSSPAPSTSCAGPSQAKTTVAAHPEASTRRPAESPPAPEAGLSASQLQQSLSSDGARQQILELLSGAPVSPDQAQLAADLLGSLGAADFARTFKRLCAQGHAERLFESLPPEATARLLEAAVRSGALEEAPGRAAPEHSLKAPDQPALIRNERELPNALRKVIHAENQRRADAYTKEYDRYVDAYCEQVKSTRNPLQLRGLGDVSSPPSLIEPGTREADRELLGNLGLTGSNRGLERIRRTVSDQISAFRGQIRAGGYGLSIDLSGKATIGKVFNVGGSIGATVTDDARIVDAKAKPKVGVGASMSHDEATDQPGVTNSEVGKTGVALDVDAKGNVSGRATVVGIGVAQSGSKTSFVAPVPFGLSAETFVDAEKGQYGASLGYEKKGKAFGGQVEWAGSAKVSLTAQGVPREYYQDIGGTQAGVFGPMPELDQGAAWSSLTKDRQAWYERQGFSAKNWPGSP